MTPVGDFDIYLAVDWSGAKGAAHKGIAVAGAMPGEGAPVLISPPEGRYWSRRGVLAYLRSAMASGKRVLAGFDCSFSLPHMPGVGFFPGLGPGPEDAAGLWALIDGICEGAEDLYAGPFVDHADFRPYFRRVGEIGARFSPRLRLTESACAAQGLGRAVSSFHLIGANQVGLGSLAAMRFLHHLRAAEPQAAIWPYARVESARLVVLEIYTRLFLTAAGVPIVKIRERAALTRALAVLGSRAALGDEPFDDHASDALVSVAGLRAVVQGDNRDLWQPQGLDAELAKREGWTFGVR